MIRAAIFDLDGVIRRFDVASLTEIEQRHGLAPKAILAALLQSERHRAAITGRLSDEAWREAAAAELGTAGREFLAWEGMSGYVDFVVLDLVRRLRRRIPVALLTNATSRLSADLRTLSLEGEFDFVVNTSELGFAKPDLLAFDHTSTLLGFSPQEILFVDDTSANVEAALNGGFDAHRFISAEDLEAALDRRVFPDDAEGAERGLRTAEERTLSGSQSPSHPPLRHPKKETYSRTKAP